VPSAKNLIALAAALPLVAAGFALAEESTPPEAATPLPSAPVVAPPVPSAPTPAAAPAPAAPGPRAVTPRPQSAATEPAPLRPDPRSLSPKAPSRFDNSLDALVREGIVTPAERARVRSASALFPTSVPAHQKACSSGALSVQECRSGMVVRWRGRNPGSALEGTSEAALAAFGGNAQPLAPLTVPVSALLAGPGGSFSLSQVFRVTPRPAPIAGNGNRRLLFPLIGSAATSSGFGWRLHPVLGSWLMHSGRDLAAPEGTPVVAALAGRVVSSGPAGGYGLAIEVEHERPRRRTLYGHLSELYVQPGDRVRQGEVIGRVGSTGLSTGPHLHFELRLPQDGGWVAVDPGDLDPGGSAVGSDAIALLMGQLLQTLERPAPTRSAG
jgi:murein DD-endopeptidase MepM/ murein hydrolase activator NlpD